MKMPARLKEWFRQASLDVTPPTEQTARRKASIEECIDQDIDTSQRLDIHEFTIAPDNPYARVTSPSHLRSNSNFNEKLKQNILRVIDKKRRSGVQIRLEESDGGYPTLLIGY
jgi:hypothetical protein